LAWEPARAFASEVSRRPCGWWRGGQPQRGRWSRRVIAGLASWLGEWADLRQGQRGCSASGANSRRISPGRHTRARSASPPDPPAPTRTTQHPGYQPRVPL